jgi:hypothetical protein
VVALHFDDDTLEAECAGLAEEFGK